MDQHACHDTAPEHEGSAAYNVLEPATGLATGLVFCSPHSGSVYPPDMRSCADPASVRRVEDAAMDQLIATAPAKGAAVLLARFGRAYVDLNRSEKELDPALITDCPVQYPGPKTLAGYGVLHRLSGSGEPLYARRLDMAEVEARLQSVHRPYHRQLSRMMQDARAQKGRAVLVDWHSMPQRATGHSGPDIILGDRHGSSCATFWTRSLRALFEAQGWRVGLNRPYAGGYATQLWGRPHEDFHAVQIEVNRRLYWDEAAHQPGAGWKRCESALKRVIAELCAIAGEIPNERA